MDMFTLPRWHIRKDLTSTESEILIQVLRGTVSPWVRSVLKLFPHYNEVLLRNRVPFVHGSFEKTFGGNMNARIYSVSLWQ